jgi:hypothetical protein
MLESYASLRLLTPDAAADTLVKLIADIRRVLVAEMQNDAKLTAVFGIVDAAAPPPPGDFPQPVRGPAA